MKKILALTAFTFAFASTGLLAETPAQSSPTPAVPAQVHAPSNTSAQDGHKKRGKKGKHRHRKPKDKTEQK